MHSTVSDGSLSVAELVRSVHAAGVAAFVLTDHDSVAGWEQTSELAGQLGLRTLPGVEISTQADGIEHHILGYGFDPDDAGLRRMFGDLQEKRRLRIPQLVSRLNELGVPLELESVLRIAGDSNPGRPHVARALVEGGYCRDVQDAFDRYLGDGRPAHIRKPTPASAAAIEAVHAAGGIAVWAHPCARPIQRPGGLAQVVSELVAAGIDGLEVLHPSHASSERRRLRKLARQHGLITTGGSDYHGSRASDTLLGHARDGEGIPLELFEGLPGASG
jgi:predicted metal-dependent phosphoesterase TrpH